MIRSSISRSKGYASLSKDSQVLFPLIIANLNSHGKQNGNTHFVKGEICPLIDWLDLRTIEACLKEISEKTHIKWFKSGDLYYLHALSWHKHQDLPRNKLGKDFMPSYPQALVQEESKSSPDLVQHEVKDQAQVKKEDKDQIEGHGLIPTNGLSAKAEKLVRQDIANAIKSPPHSEAVTVRLNEIINDVAKRKDVRNRTGYIRQSARNLGKPYERPR